MNEDRQRDLLMAQIQNKRALRQKYLRQKGGTGNGPETALSGLVMTNMLLFSIQERADIFGALRRLRTETDPNGLLLDTVLGWLQSVAELLGCGAYDLLIDDGPKRRRIVEKLLRDLESCDSWENIRVDGQGGSFALPGFDYAYRMSDQPSATLLFEKTALGGDDFRYTLTLGDGSGSMGLIPSQGILWQETQGPLQVFTDRVLAERNGWPARKARFDQVGRNILAEAETLRDLTALLEEAPDVDLTPLLRKEADKLKDLRQQERAAYEQMPGTMQASDRGRQVQNTLLLLGGAVTALEGMLRAMPDAPRETLSEIVYLLESAAGPL